MRRREFITLVGVAAASWPLAARAQQQPRPIRTIGVLSGMSNEGQGQIYVKTLRDRLKMLGWIDGQNVRVEYRWASGDASNMRMQAAEMIGARPDVIVAITPPAVAALQQQTRKIPLVFGNMSDPVDGGYVQSMARPGGNITGFTSFEYSIGGKWLELLKEAVPSIKRVLVLHNPDNYTSRALLGTIVNLAPTVGVQVKPEPVQSAAEIEAGIIAFANENNGGLLLLPDPIIQVNLPKITGLAAKHRLPSLYQSREFPSNGGLMSYGTDFLDLYRRVADYVDRILKGANVGELPVQNPVKFELVINLKVAKAIGIQVPSTLLARADEVIE
jgi:putative tryptophan/tyrosine transport system substrate-binding protein